MRRRPAATVIVLCGGIIALAGGSPAPERTDDAEKPQPSELVERAASRLVQLDVTVHGPGAAGLTEQDLSLKVNLTRIHEFQLDRLCAGPGSAREPAAAPATYMLYFDQSLLTLRGRQQALDQARTLVPRLAQAGGRVMIVSNARRLAVVHEPTSEADRLLQALARLENDRSQWDSFAEEEDSRVGRIVEALNKDTVEAGISLARSFQREELWHTAASLRRLTLALSWLAADRPPKAVLYFADTMRQNPGEHYLGFFGPIARLRTSVNRLETDNLLATPPFDQLVNHAAAQGVRFYPVLAHGLVGDVDEFMPSSAAIATTGAPNPSSWHTRRRDTENSLGSLATETGGHAFLHGDPASRIAERILNDLSCLYLLSFSPSGFAEDAPLRVVLKSRRPDIELQSRGRVVIQSESTRLAARLLSAFVLEPADGAGSLEAQLVPTGFDDGAWSALLQVSVPASTLPSATWDVGASVVARDRVRGQVSGRLAFSGAGRQLVLEREVRLEPGWSEIITVAHETTSDLTLSGHQQVRWPDPAGRRATCGPIAVLQPAEGVFLRDGVTRSSGSLARPELEPLSRHLPTALMALVCRGHREGVRLTVERTLSADSRIDFPPLEIELDDERCAQVRDLIPAGGLGPGSWRYEIRLLRNGEELHSASRELLVDDREE